MKRIIFAALIGILTASAATAHGGKRITAADAAKGLKPFVKKK